VQKNVQRECADPVLAEMDQVLRALHQARHANHSADYADCPCKFCGIRQKYEAAKAEYEAEKHRAEADALPFTLPVTLSLPLQRLQTTLANRTKQYEESGARRWWEMSRDRYAFSKAML
jgi:hypothetical protein